MDLLPFALVLTVGIAAAETITLTKLPACSSGSLTLSSEVLKHVDMTLISEAQWKYRYTQGTTWIKALHCNRSMVCVLYPRIKPVLPDGTRISSGANGSLIVEHSAQNSSIDHVQFMFEVHWTDGSVDYHIFEVKFTVVCVCTWKDANLNFTSVMFNMYPVEQVVEIEVFDSKGTKFAHLNNELRATVGLKGSHRSMPYFWNRLTVTDGSLMLTGIQMEDNGLEIRAEWHLTPLNSRPRRSNMESVRVKTIRVLVNDVITSQGPSSVPSPMLPSSISKVKAVNTSSSPSTTVPSSSSPSTTFPERWPPTMPCVHGQPWAVILVALVTFLYSNLR